MIQLGIEEAQRLRSLPRYLFSEMEKAALEKKRQGVDLISFGIGDPDLPTPDFVLDVLREEVSNPRNHNYSLSQGELEFREAVAEWYKKRFRVDLDSSREVLALIGSKEGLANLARAYINPGDKVLVPDPAYPVYMNGATLLCDGVPVVMPLLEKNGFKPELDKISSQEAKIIFLNYPNNPTSATVESPFLEELVEFARRNRLIICYDNAYSEIAFDGFAPPSLMEIDGAKDVGIEIHSCSKTFNMTGDRIGFAVGNERVIADLARIKSQIDSGPPLYVQKAAIRALGSYTFNGPPKCVRENVATYQERRDVLVRKLKYVGLRCEVPKATFYVWANCGMDSMEFSKKALEKGVMVTPGVGFGNYGEGFIRFAFTIPVERIAEACERMESVM
jgi:LL-diaminopimelate aminotransferase